MFSFVCKLLLLVGLLAGCNLFKGPDRGNCNGPKITGSNITLTNTQACGGDDASRDAGATVTTPAPVVVPPVVVPPVVTQSGAA